MNTSSRWIANVRMHCQIRWATSNFTHQLGWSNWKSSSTAYRIGLSWSMGDRRIDVFLGLSGSTFMTNEWLASNKLYKQLSSLNLLLRDRYQWPLSASLLSLVIMYEPWKVTRWRKFSITGGRRTWIPSTQQQIQHAKYSEPRSKIDLTQTG